MENLFRMYLLLTEIAASVIRRFFEWKCGPDNFQNVLNHQKHVIYHLFSTRGKCCKCNLPVHLSRQSIIKKGQFDQLFDSHGQKCGSGSQNCCCVFTAKPNIQLTDIDLTLCITLVTNCFESTLQPQEDDSLKIVRGVRNEVAHWSYDNIDDGDFYRMWGQVNMAVSHLSRCIEEEYFNEIMGQIRRLETRTISQTEYAGILHQLLIWRNESDERLSNVEKSSERIECKIDDLHKMFSNHMLIQQESNFALQETQLKYIPVCSKRDDVTKLEDREEIYFKVFQEIEDSRRKGDADEHAALIYSILVYIVLQGSVSENSISRNILDSIYMAAYNRTLSTESLGTVSRCLIELLGTHIDQIEDNFTVRDTTTANAVINSFGDACPQCFVELCNFDIMFDTVVPNHSNENLICVRIDISVLMITLIQRMQLKNNAVHVGKYIRKLTLELKEAEAVDLFLDLLDQCEDKITADQMILLLEGMTCNGQNFDCLDKCPRFLNSFCRQIDSFGNTTFHYIVSNFNESNAFDLYVEYFCKTNISVMQIENDEDHYSPIDFAAYLGRSKTIAEVVCNVDKNDEMIRRILTMVKHGVEGLQQINTPYANYTSKVHIELEKIIFGDFSDFKNILSIIGEGHLIDDVESNKEVQTEITTTEKENLSKVVGEKIINLVVNIKQGFKAFGEIPNLVKEINQVTKLEDGK